MSNIIKSRAIVDEAPPLFSRHEVRGMELISQSVIKNRVLNAPDYHPPTDILGVAPKNAYLDEINRYKVEIEEARAELRRIRSEADEARESAIREQEQRLVDHEIVDDSVFTARKQEIEELIENANILSSQAIQDAERESAQLKEQARNDGYLEGFNKGYEESVMEYRQTNQPKADLLADLVERLSDYEAERLRRNENELVALAAAIASKILSREIKEDPAAVRDMLRHAVEDNHSEAYIRITLAPDLLPIETKASTKVIDMLEAMGANISVYTDREAASGTVILETPKGITDLSINTQMENIQGSLTGE